MVTMPSLRDKRPWIFRTYAGHSTAEESNRLYRRNLGKGQTGLSVAFDLPTQTGYDSDHPLARGEVGRVGVAISHIGDMRQLLAEIPLDAMNSSMTINATAAWLLALYVAVADERGIARPLLTGTTQNDIIKEYLSRGTHIFPPVPSLKLTRDVIGFCTREMPKWNPVNVCSYHLQEAGATPIQEIAYALSTAVTILDGVKQDAQIAPETFPAIVGRMSFFVNAGMKLITEICKLRAFGALWDEICRERYCISEERFRRFRFGVQVNSLGLTEQQPENNIHRILIELLAVVLSKNARARAVQLPAWNEAMGLPRPWDQQWSLRMQQIVAYETDLLEYGDIFDGSHEIAKQTQALIEEARGELNRVLEMGGAAEAVEEGYMKRQLVAANSERLRAIENGETVVVGVNAFLDSEASPLSGGAMVANVGDSVEYEQIARLRAWRAGRNNGAAKLALAGLARTAEEGGNIMEASIACAMAGVTTGEWGGTLREIFGEYRAPTGLTLAAASEERFDLAPLRQAVSDLSAKLGEPVGLMIAKPGLDGHSNGAEQIALRAQRCGIAVSYDGIRMTPEQIVAAARDRKPHIIGLSVLSGSHVPLVREVMNRLRDAGLSGTPVVAGGIISAEDEHVLKQLGVRRVYTPKDFRLNQLIAEMIEIIEARLSEDAA
jgi:(2R)-ethylmalonyl-CoA mutase